MKTSVKGAALIFLFTLLSQAESLENSVAALGDANFAQREEAEATLKAAGSKALPFVEASLDSDDPEVALRVRRIRDYILAAVDDRMPEALAADLPEFETLPDARQDEIIRELATLTPPHLTGLASLHSRLFGMEIPGDRRSSLLSDIENAIQEALPIKDLSEFGSLLLDARTRALLLNLAAADGGTRDLDKTYVAWRTEHPAIRFYLNRSAVELEIGLLRKNWDKRGALAFVAEIKDEQAFRKVVSEFRDWMLGDPELKFDELEGVQAIAYLELTFESSTPGAALPLFRKLAQQIPGLPQKLRPERSTPLQALQLWESGKQAKATEILYPEGKAIPDGTEFLGQMILDSQHVDFPRIISRITPDSTEKLSEILVREPISEGALNHAINLSAQSRALENHSPGTRLKGATAQKIALDLWKNGQADLCYRFMQEAFWNADDSDEWRLSHFPALASAMGRLDEAIASSEEIPGQTKARDLKTAYLYRAAGRSAEALTLSSLTPESDLHTLLLIESRNWSALARNSKKKDELTDWFAYLNGDLEKWRGDVPEPEKNPADCFSC